MPRTKGAKDNPNKPRKRRGKKTTHIRVEEEKKPYLRELAKKSISYLIQLVKGDDKKIN